MMISVWGPSGSGKTTIAAKLAKEYAKNQNVILILAGQLNPGIPQIVAEKGGDKKSIGRLLSQASISTDAILSECVTTKSDNLAVLGYDYGENIYSYADYFEPTAIDLLSKIKVLADVVIVDCSSDFGHDILSTVSLTMSEHIVRVCTAEPKSMLYFDSIMPLFMDNKRFKLNEHLRVLNNIKGFQDKKLASEKYQGIDLEIEYSEELEKQMLELSLLEKDEEKSNLFTKQLIKLINGEPLVEKKKSLFKEMFIKPRKEKEIVITLVEEQ